MSATPVRVSPVGPERLEELRPLWLALHDHHTRIPARMAAVRERSRGGSWRRRRAVYERYLAQRDCFCLVAERDCGAIGYAMVWVGCGLSVGAGAGPLAYLTSLSVLPADRGAGIGAALLREVRARSERVGARQLLVGVRTWNERALRFYAAHGFSAVTPGTLFAPLQPAASGH
jgi:ribosomal protein S18 acetylase RimI-like enzyme